MRLFAMCAARLMRIYGESMSPALAPRTLVLVDSCAYAQRAPQRGEIVAARPASLGGRALVKRLAGLPHQRVEIDGRRWTLGPDEYFLLGDHAHQSTDSRTFGPVTREELIGQVLACVWPWRRLATRDTEEGTDGKNFEVS